MLNQQTQDALQNSLSMIHRQFAIDSVTVVEPYIYLPRVTDIMNDDGAFVKVAPHMVHIEPGTYPVGDESRFNLNAPGLIEACPLLANHLHAIGKASLNMKSGDVRPVKKMEA